MSRTLAPAEIREMITKAPAFELELVWIPKIMENQTADEVTSEHTRHSNGRGLSGADAPRITYYFRLLQEGKHLTEGQARVARERLQKYASQYSAMTGQGVTA